MKRISMFLFTIMTLCLLIGCQTPTVTIEPEQPAATLEATTAPTTVPSTSVSDTATTVESDLSVDAADSIYPITN